MFDRPVETYKVAKGTIKGVLSDPASPLYQVVNTIEDGAVVLDAGAGNGLLAMLFKAARKDVVIDGIESSKEAAKIARPHYREFFQGYVQDYYDILKKNDYDYIVLADVIEHIVNPEEFLRELLRKTGSKTKIVISTPNVAFASIRLALLDGNFDYVDSGLLEKTHLRFFTRATLEKMISNLNVGVESVKFLQRRFNSTEVPVRLKRNACILPRLFSDDLASTYQFFFVLNKNSKESTFANGKKVGAALRKRDIIFRL